jgi:hypothetical protein
VAIIDERVEYRRVALGNRVNAVAPNIVAPAVVFTTAQRAALDALEHLAPSLSIEERGNCAPRSGRHQAADRRQAPVEP